VRVFLALLMLPLSGCGPGLVFNASQNMTSGEMLQRADLVFVGVIQKHRFDSWPLLWLSIPGETAFQAHYWKLLRRQVRVELLIRGDDRRKVIDVYEFFWTGGASGDWNFTRDGDRSLFLVRRENGRYHVVRDWWRSIHPVTTALRNRLPLDDSHDLWERIALMNWWVQSGSDVRISHLGRSDPGGALSIWRVIKLERGLARHPSPHVRVAACRELLLLGGWLQDECWDTLSEDDRSHLSDGGYFCCKAGEIAKWRAQAQRQGAQWIWRVYSSHDNRRLHTTVSDPHLRREFCRMWERDYPDDHDNGCPPHQQPPATIVTEQGDVPLIGPWPQRENQPAVKLGYPDPPR
jgi:hypothetical protein